MLTIIDVAQALSVHIKDVSIQFINTNPIIVIRKTHDALSNQYAIAFSNICYSDGGYLFRFDEDDMGTIHGEYRGYSVWFEGFNADT